MKIAAIVQFYLDAVFPRDPSWSGWTGVRLDAPTFTAHVRPWDPTMGSLFPEDVDRSLAGTIMSLVPIDTPGGAIRRTIADTVVDRIEVDLRWEEDASAAPPAFDLELTQDRAIDAANVLIEHIRTSAGAASIPRVRRAWRPQDGRFYLLTPWTMTVYDADSGDQLPVFAGFNAMLSPGALRAPETGIVTISNIEHSLRAGVEPLLHSILLLDAETAVEGQALREAVLAIASACEVAASMYIESKVSGGAAAYKQTLRGTFASKFYEQAPSCFSSRSLQQDDPSAFALIEEMYRERNKIIHGGRMTPRLSDLSSRERQRTVYAYLSAGNRAVDWITALT